MSAKSSGHFLWSSSSSYIYLKLRIPCSLSQKCFKWLYASQEAEICVFDLERDEPLKTFRMNSSKSEQLPQSPEFLNSKEL